MLVPIATALATEGTKRHSGHLSQSSSLMAESDPAKSLVPWSRSARPLEHSMEHSMEDGTFDVAFDGAI